MSAATMTVMLALLGLAPAADPEADPASLVARLGSSKFAEREAASRSLQELGPRALPALRAARESKDPEVRTRVAVLVDKIESDLIVRPTLVTLDFRDRPIREVVQSLAEQTKLPLQLVNEALPRWRETRITLEAPEPVPLWAALDRLCEAGHLGYNPNVFVNMGQGPRHVFQINEQHNALTEPGAVVVNGPFRLALTELTHIRQRTFHAGAGNVVGGMRPVIGGIRQPMVVGAGAAAGNNLLDNFNFGMQIMAEPRLILAMNGPLKLTEAVDDAGNSLLPPQAHPNNAMIQHMAYFGGWNQGGAQILPLNGLLTYPEKAGRSIKRLKGVVPLSVATRKSDPIVIPLANSAGKSFQAGETTILIHDPNKPNPNPGQQGTLIDLTIRTAAAGGSANPNFNNGPLGGQPQLQIELVDAQGKPVSWFPQSSNGRPGEVRLGLLAQVFNNGSPPAQLKYYELVRVSTEVTFEFHDIPLP